MVKRLSQATSEHALSLPPIHSAACHLSPFLELVLKRVLGLEVDHVPIICIRLVGTDVVGDRHLVVPVSHEARETNAGKEKHNKGAETPIKKQ